MGEGGGSGGVLTQKCINLVDVISCILVHPWGGQLGMGNALIGSDS